MQSSGILKSWRGPNRATHVGVFMSNSFFRGLDKKDIMLLVGLDRLGLGNFRARYSPIKSKNGYRTGSGNDENDVSE